MVNIGETLSALEQLKGRLDTIGKSEIAEAERMLRNLVTDIVSIEKKELSENAAMLRSLATDVITVEKKEFSFMKTFGIENLEFAHSNFLAWLLDPLEDHGLGSQFAEKFICKVASKTKIDASLMDFSNLHVEREISSDQSRLDISISDPLGSFFCVIENKIKSREGEDQTNRLYIDFHDARNTKELFVFLTLNERAKPENSNFTSLTYKEVLPILKSLLGNSINDDISFLIKNYINTLERLIMSEKFEGFSERTKLYYQYEKYIDAVRKAFDQDRQLLLSALENEIKHRNWWDEKLCKIDKTGGDITIWKNAWYPSEHEGVYLQLYLHKSEPAFSLYIYGEPSEFSTKFAPTFRRFLDEEHPGKLAGGFFKTFAKGVSKFIEKNIHLSLTERYQQEILKNLDEMVGIFEKIIDRSIEEFIKKQKSSEEHQ